MARDVGAGPSEVGSDELDAGGAPCCGDGHHEDAVGCAGGLESLPLGFDVGTDLALTQSGEDLGFHHDDGSARAANAHVAGDIDASVLVGFLAVPGLGGWEVVGEAGAHADQLHQRSRGPGVGVGAEGQAGGQRDFAVRPEPAGAGQMLENGLR